LVTHKTPHRAANVNALSHPNRCLRFKRNIHSSVPIPHLTGITLFGDPNRTELCHLLRRNLNRKPPKNPLRKALPRQERAKSGFPKGEFRSSGMMNLAGSEPQASQRKDKAARDCEMQCSKRRHHVSRSQPVSWSWLIGCKEECHIK
jgi:hypothetical protein